MGKLYLIPTPLGEIAPEQVLPPCTLEECRKLRVFVVEELRTARRFLSAAGFRGGIDSLEFHVLNEHSTKEEIEFLPSLLEKSDVGLITEAGLPAVADPGAPLVALCHRKGIEVVPLIGPSSLLMALMASGMNGQSFAFRGYLSAKAEERKRELKELEKISISLNQSQILIETPYRNDAFFQDALSTLRPTTRICVAADISLETQFIRTREVALWKKSPVTIGKRPCVFIIQG